MALLTCTKCGEAKEGTAAFFPKNSGHCTPRWGGAAAS